MPATGLSEKGALFSILRASALCVIPQTRLWSLPLLSFLLLLLLPGEYCEAEINECASFPCQHNGTCVDLLGRYECRCPAGTWTHHLWYVASASVMGSGICRPFRTHLWQMWDEVPGRRHSGSARDETLPLWHILGKEVREAIFLELFMCVGVCLLLLIIQLLSGLSMGQLCNSQQRQPGHTRCKNPQSRLFFFFFFYWHLGKRNEDIQSHHQCLVIWPEMRRYLVS